MFIYILFKRPFDADYKHEFFGEFTSCITPWHETNSHTGGAPTQNVSRERKKIKTQFCFLNRHYWRNKRFCNFVGFNCNPINIEKGTHLHQLQCIAITKKCMMFQKCMIVQKTKYLWSINISSGFSEMTKLNSSTSWVDCGSTLK